MTLSSGKLNDIANLYESITAFEQEVLNEYAGGATPASQMGGPPRPRFGPTPAQQAQTSRTALQKGANVTISKPSGDPLSRAFGGKDTAGTAHLNSAATKSQGRTVVNFNNTQPTYRSGSQPGGPGSIQLGGQKLYSAKLGGKDVYVGAKPAGAPPRSGQPPAGGAQPPAGGASRPAAGAPGAGPAKTPPAAAKPAIPTGTTAGGTTFQRRAATGAELRAAQAARAAGKGEEGAIKAGVAASKPAATPAATSSRNGFGASTAQMAAQSSVRSATAPGSEVAATNKAAANPSSGTTPLRPASAPPTPTERTGGAPLRDNPLWDMKGDKPQKSTAPNRPEGPLWEGVDAYDIVLEYLLDTGHAESVAEAQYIMTELDQESIAEIAEQSIGSRAANAVGHQREGTLGDDDEIRQNQDSTSASIGKMKRGSGAKVTPTLPGV